MYVEVPGLVCNGFHIDAHSNREALDGGAVGVAGAGYDPRIITEQGHTGSGTVAL